jgi:cytochrome P450
MQAVTDLDLAYLPIEDEAFAQDPFPHFAAARARHSWLAKCSFGYLVFDYGAIRDLMVHENRMVMGHNGITEIMGARHTPWGEFIAGSIQSQSGDTHKRLRMAVGPAFTPRQANLHRPLMREVISRLLDEWVPKGSFDFEEFAAYFPISVMCRMLGAEPTVIPKIREALEALGLAFSMDRKYLPMLQESVVMLDGFVRQHIAARRAGKRLGSETDLLDLLLKARADETLSEEELANLLIFLFAAGYDTSKNVITMIMHAMIDRPEIYARMAGDAPFCRKVMDETMRYFSPSAGTRLLVEDIVVRDVLLPKGIMIMIPWSVTGRGPDVVKDPEVLDPDRPEGTQHMAFGRGPKICLGQFIARAQIEEALPLIAQRIKNPRRAGPPGWRPFPGVWGIKGLPIAFEAGGV